ncbi:MAG: LysR family transcriptional regulator [Rhizobiaceae bacterium]|jgi:DNA-binding transcriptional LysR family regulator|nr:LysR family transcriptional regulator [Rhizobiaceae bacterium]
MSKQLHRNSHVKITERVSTRLKLKQLRLLVAIAEHSSILHAAEELFISQPAATKLLKDLETDFGVTLFSRTNRGVIPTEFGEALVRHGKLILAQISHAAQELDDLNEGLGGRVVVGTLLAASAELLPETIRNVHEQRPNVSIIVRDGTNDFLMPLVYTGEVDMVVGRLAEYRYREDLSQEVLYNEPAVVVCRSGHQLAKAKHVPFSQLVEQDWILPPTQTTLRRQVDKEFLDQDLPPPPNPVECVSFLTNRALLMSTDMIGVFPLHVVRKEILAGELVTVQCPLQISNSPVGVTYRSEKALSPAAASFLDELRKHAKAIKERESATD